jgi:hypothetical protein
MGLHLTRAGRRLMVPALMVGAIAASVVQAYRGYQALEGAEGPVGGPGPQWTERLEPPLPAQAVARPAVTTGAPRTPTSFPAAGGPETGARWRLTPVSAPATGPMTWPAPPVTMSARPADLRAAPPPTPQRAGLAVPATGPAGTPAWSPVATPRNPPRPAPWSERPRREGKSCGFGFG